MNKFKTLLTISMIIIFVMGGIVGLVIGKVIMRDLVIELIECQLNNL